MQLSRNFSLEEFVNSPTATQYGINNAPQNGEIIPNLKELANTILQPLRDFLGRPLKIDSGYRCPELNQMVGGVPTSQHTKGEASDIYTGSQDVSRELAKTIVNLGLPFDQLILYPTFVHVSHSRAYNRNQVLYNRRYHGMHI